MEPRLSLITLGVADMGRSFDFYHEGLGFPSSQNRESGWIAFQTGGVCLSLYPFDLLAQDIDPALSAAKRTGYGGITLAHNTRTKAEVDEVLHKAVAAGAALVKPAAETSWGGYGGYFADPDGYLWEVAWGPNWKFNPDGSLVIE